MYTEKLIKKGNIFENVLTGKRIKTGDVNGETLTLIINGGQTKFELPVDSFIRLIEDKVLVLRVSSTK